MMQLRKQIKATLWVLMVCVSAAAAVAPYFDTASSSLLVTADAYGFTVAAANHLKSGVTFNKRVERGQIVSVGFCDATEVRIAGLHPGGDDFVRPCTSGITDLCVNARDSAEAARALEPVLKQHGLTVGLAVFFGHGSPGRQMIGRRPVTADILELLSDYRAPGNSPEINFMGCNVADGEKGRRYLQEVATKYRFLTYASCDSVGWEVAVRVSERNFSVNQDAIYVAVPDGEGVRKHNPAASATNSIK